MDLSTTRYRTIAESFVHMIQGGALAPMEKMPSIREVARRYNASVSTAVQAYRWLEDARWIEARPRSGYFVTPRPQLSQQESPSRPQMRPLDVRLPAEARTVVAMASRPEIISFGAACPSPELFDNDRIRRIVNRTVQRHRNLLTHYPLNSGLPELRKAIARHATGYGCALSPERIIVTGGALESIATALRATTKPGDVVAVESPCFYGFLEILQALHLKGLEVPCDPERGISLPDLRLALESESVRAVLLVPTLSNPLGASMPPQARAELCLLAAEYSIPVIEDVVYNDLVEDTDLRHAVKAFDRYGNVIICGSFSKTVAPGVRLGWMEPGRWHDEVLRLRMATSSGQSPVMEMALAQLLTQPGLAQAQRKMRTKLAIGMAQTRQAIEESFPSGTHVTTPKGGFLVWVKLPTNLDSHKLYQACLTEGICIAPGELFSVSNCYKNFIRLGVDGSCGIEKLRALRKVGAIATDMQGPETDTPVLGSAECV